MPGIAGLISNSPRDAAVEQLRRMVAVLKHEPFYESGIWINESLGVYVGWVAHKGSFSDGMPLSDETGAITLVFSGEEYPEPGTVAGLKARGHKVVPYGPSYLVHLYEDEAGFPVSLNGRFHGLVADGRKQHVLLFNDRYGMHRLYYHEAKEGFYFAAEAKAILAVRPELRNVDLQGLGELISCGSVLENRSVFRKIYVMPPASGWIFRAGALAQKTCYFEARDWEEKEPLDSETYYRELRDVFSRNLPRYFNGEQQIGMSLTGGFDTRAVMAWQKRPCGKLPCYTYGGMFRECQDVRVARRVARACNQPHYSIAVDGKFLAQFPHYAERSVYLTDACTDLVRSPDLYISERVREIAPVRMTGLYGDEVLRHLRAFKPVRPSPGIFSDALQRHISEAGSTYDSAVAVHPLSFSVFRQAPWHHYGILALEQTQLTVRTPFLDNEFIQTVFRSPKSATASNDVRLRLIEDGNPSLTRIRTDRGFRQRKSDLTMAVLRQYLEFTYKAEYAYDYGMPQWLAQVDHVFEPLHLERLFLGRHKLYHFRIWYRHNLAGYVREMLLDTKSLSRPYLEPKGVEAAVQSHIRGTRNYTLEIHKLLTLELLHRLFIDL